MDSQNGLPNPLLTELQPHPLVQPDLFTVDSSKQQPTALFSVNEQLIEKTIEAANSWKVVTEPFPIGTVPTSFGEGVVNSWLTSNNAPNPVTISDAALLNSLFAKLQTPAPISIAQYPAETIRLSKDLAISQIQAFLNRPDRLEQFKIAFGQDIERSTIDKIIGDWQKQNSKLPDIEILSAQILGKADGGFDTVNNKIYLARSLIERGNLAEIVPVLIEEFGHYLDSKIHPGGDAVGDEGEIFSKLVRGISISPSEYVTLVNEDDHATIILNQTPTVIEQSVTTNYAIKAEKTVSFNGSSDLDGNPLDLSDDALVYGGKGFTFNGNSILPVKYDASGNPLKNSQGKLVLVDKAVTVAAGYLQANINGTGTKYAGLTPPQIVTAETIIVPLFADIKQQELNRKIPTGTPTITFNISTNPINTAAQWATKFPPAGTATVPKVVRVTSGGLNIPGTVNLSNYVIVVDSGDINFNGTGSLSNVTLVASNGNINLNAIQSDNLSALASGTINHNSSARFGGNSLFANGTGNITFNGATKGITTNDNLWVISAGNITFNGSQSTRGSFVAQGNFTANGSTNIYGTVSSKQNVIFNGSLNFTYANIRNYSDSNPPVILANLVTDSGSSNSDKITNDSRISGTVTDASQITSFKAGFDSKPLANYTDVFPYLTNGSFSFTKAQLETIYGGTIPDGSHTLNLIATDQYGNQSSVYPYTFTLDTTTPVPTLNLAVTSDTGVAGDYRTKSALVTLTGKVEANAKVLLSGNPTPVTADSAGNYTFANVALAAGNNSFTVTATDIAGNQKAFTQIVYRTSPPTGVNLSTPQILENSANNTQIGGLGTTDPDGVDNYVYTLVNDAGGRFKLVGDKIQVANGSLLDFEANIQHQIQVRTTDGEGDSYLQTIAISVLNVNESPNNLLVLPTVILENSPNNTIVGQITSTDPDAGDNFSYSLVAGTGDGDNSKLAISGDKLVIKNSPDYETQASYTIRLKTTDAGGLSYEKQVTISVTNVNEAPTSLVLSNNSVAENIGVNGVIGTFTSADPDLGDTRTYTLISGLGDSDNSQFTIVGDKLQINPNPDFETKSTYQLRVKVTDAGGLSYQQAFTVNISDVNEAPTSLVLSNNTVAENIGTNGVIGTFTSADLDLGDTRTYSLISGLGDSDNNQFTIVGDKLQLNPNPDFETKSTYQLRARVTDAGGLSYDRSFTVSITDVNEAPTALNISNTTLAENVSGGTVVGSLSAIDSDINDTQTFSLVAGAGDTNNSAFSIVGTQLIINNSPDFEAQNNYSLRVRVSDGAGLTFERVININITDINEAPTGINLSGNNIAENSSDNSTIGMLTTIDPDLIDTVSYTLTDDANGRVKLVGNELKVANGSLLDFEANTQHQITISSTDKGGLTFFRQFTIGVNNVNEIPLDFSLSNNIVAENIPVGGVIGDFSTIDPDLGDTHTYTLVNGTGSGDNSAFSIVNNQLKFLVSPNFEAKSNYSLRVRTTDGSGLNLEKTLTVSISNVNEAPTQLVLDTTSVAENSPIGTLVGKFTSTDPDLGDSHSYSLVTGNGSGDNAKFSIVSNELRLNISPDFETQSVYYLRVQTADAGGLIWEQELTVGITDVNESVPITLVEGTSFNKQLDIPIIVPATGGKLSFKLNPLQFDGADLNGINDALEVALVDAQSKSVVTSFQTGRDAFFNWTEGEPVATGKGANYDPATGIVTLDLTGVKPGAANLVFRLINNDTDTTTSVTVTDITLAPIASTPASVNSVTSILPTTPKPVALTFFNSATDVSASIGADYHRTSFNATTKELDVNVALKNQGNYGLNGTLVVVVNHISDPSVQVKNADGFTPEGLAYYTFTTVNGKLDPNSVTGEKTLVFRNPNGAQFSYDLTVLAELNAAPVIKSQPELAVIGGKNYQYQIKAEDLNGDSLTYKLLTAPSGMSIDPSTGLVSWNTTVGQIGNYQLAVEVSDGRGGITQQNYNLAVITPPPNRPPVFTSNPVVDANINTPYIYQITAKDLDGDSLTYSLVNAPNGMTVASDGKVNWTPTVEYLGSTVVTIKVEDSQGGSAFQNFKILTNPTPENQAPIFTSAPVTLFNLAATINAAKGNVNRQVIDLELPVGAVATQNISITLPSDGTSGADIVFVVDESGSMGDARSWISNMVLDLDQALNTAGITANRYAFVGYGAAAIGVNFSPEEQIQVYTIEGKAGETLYFDLEPDQVTGFSWILYGANRQVVKSSTSDFEVTLSTDGKYSLLVKNPTTISKAYRYKIVNSQPTVKLLNFSEITTGIIQVIGEQNKYVFSGEMGDKIYFDGISSNVGNSIVASLKTDENISIFADILLANNSNLFILPKTGDYVLTVDGQNDAIGDYTFRLSQEKNTTLLDLNNNQINLTLDPKKSIVYNFDGIKGQRLLFDSLSNVSGVWKLIGPSNQPINAATNLNTDFSVTLSADGNYWLLLEPTNTTPVNYSFKVQSNQEAALANSGFNSLHTGLLNPGQQQIHTFTASGGTLVYLDNQDLTTGSISIQIKDANGTLVSTITNTSDSGVINLSRSGEYSLIVKNASTSATSDYAFQMLDLANGEVVDRNISILGSLPVTNGAKVYAFNATKGEHLYIDGLSGQSSIVSRLISPSGAILINNTAVNLNSGIINIAETGTYSLLVTSSNAPILEYSFQILDERNILPLNSVNTGSLEAGKSLVYKFISEQGQILYLNSLKTAAANWKIVNANGQIIKSGSLGTDIELPFAHHNDYWLVLENTSTLPVEYSFAATTSQANALPISFNSIITGQINVAGQKNIYTFNGNAGQNIYYDGISSNNAANLKLTLTSPDGTVIINAIATNSNSSSLVLAETGIYTLTVDALSDLVGNYSFQLLDNSKTLSLDGSTINQILNVGESLAYRFDGSKGQRLSFDSLSNVVGVWKLIGPSNQQINAATNLNTDFSVTLSADGNYWLLLKPTNTTPVNYSFKVQSNQEAALANSGFNSLHTGLLNPGQQQIHTFTASGGTLVYLDNQDLTTGFISIQIKDANSTLVSTITNTSDSGVINLSRSGEYSLIVKNASTSATSDYAFQMLDLTTGENLSINSTIISNLPVKTATKLYTFNGNAGQNIYFDSLVNNSTINVRLITPSGYPLINNLSLSADRGTINLTETGTYSLLIGAISATSLDYGFRLIDYDNPILFNTPYKLPIDQNKLFTTPLGIGQIVSAPILSSGFEDGYEAIQTSLNLLPFRAESAANIILISDEDRDILDSTLNFGNTLAALTQKGVRLNGVINGNFASSTSQAALGMSPDGTVYLADGSGGFSAGTGGLFVSASENTKRDYIDLIWANGGTAWSIGQFRGAGTNQALNATSFTKAFVDANTDAIAQQLSVNLTTTNTSGGFSNLTGIIGGVAGGQTANFTAQFTGTGRAQVYDLLFQRPDTGVVLGSVPVVVNGAYTYDAQAIDPDGDVLTYKLVNAPAGAKIDTQTGLIRWLPTKIGSYEFIVATSDGRGGTAQQTYQLAVTELPNQLPVITSTPPTQASANQPLSYQVVATDADANVLSYVVDAAPLGLTINRASGLISWTPTIQQVGQHPVSVRVLDGRGGETTQQINLTVLADSTNRAPSFTSTPQNQVEIGASYQYQVTATDADGDALTYESKLLPQGMRFDTVSQTLVWQPGSEQFGKHQVVLKVADGRGGVELQTFEIAVTTPNVAPEIVSASLTTAVANTPYRAEIRATDADGKVVS